MFLIEEYVKATMHMKGEETRRAHLVSEAREQAQQNRNGRVWRWRVEPGMEDAFQDLRGWLLSSQRDAEMEAANSPPQSNAWAPGGDPQAQVGGLAANPSAQQSVSLRGHEARRQPECPPENGPRSPEKAEDLRDIMKRCGVLARL